jgi:hypothetical protein
VPIAGRVVVAHTGKRLQLEVLVAAEVVDHPVPISRERLKSRRGVGERLHERALDRVDGIDERTQRRQLMGAGSVQRDRHGTVRVRAVMAEAVVQRLDGMPDRLRIEEVHQ